VVLTIVPLSPKAYKRIIIENIYNDIDLIYYEKDGMMKYDFVVRPGANPSIIRMKYPGAKTLYLNKSGNLIVKTSLGEVEEEKPHTYSKSTGMEIDSRFLVMDKIIQFDVAEHNENEVIIIDPVRIWATYYGGGNYDVGNSISIDGNNNVLVTGQTNSSNFPVYDPGGTYFQGSNAGSYDAFVLKFSSYGILQWATYYGGSADDCGRSISTDKNDNILVTGDTKSLNFPVFNSGGGAYFQGTNAGYEDCFIIKFNTSGERQWATYYGGNSYEVGYSIYPDKNNNILVTGVSQSNNFPIFNPGGGAYFQSTGSTSAFILKFNQNGVRQWATYYGFGSYGYSITADTNNNILVSGETVHSNFPVYNPGGGAYYQNIYGGNKDAFILKFNQNGVRQWATYYGGNQTENEERISTDVDNNILITGHTSSTNFPLHNPGGSSYFQGNKGGQFDAYILKFNTNGIRQWATYYGGTSTDGGYSICTDDSKNILITGKTGGANFPLLNPGNGAYFQNTFGGGVDAFLLKFDSSGIRKWATYYGGDGNDWGHSIIANNNDIFITGYTKSANFPLLNPGGGTYFQGNFTGSHQSFILNFSTPPTSPILISPTNYSVGNLISLNLIWSKTKYANSYRLQLSTDSLFINLLANDSTLTDTMKAINGLTPITHYWWRVNAKNNAGTSPYSSVWNFKTLGYPTQVNLIYPPDDTTQIPINVGIYLEQFE